MEVINFIIEKPGQNKVKMAFDLTDTNKNILTKICEKFNVCPEDYELRMDEYFSRYGNKLLGKNLEVSDLPPEAHLELHQCPCSSNRSVLVDLVTGNNTSSKKFKCSATLWKVSQDLLPKDRFIEDDRIQISFYGKTVVGSENLKQIQLKSLHQTEGKVTLKLDRNYSDADLANSKQQRVGNVVDSKLLKLLKSKKQGSEEHKSLHTSMAKGKKTPGYRLSTSVKALTNVDKNIYKNNKEKLKGIVQLDERKGLLYNLKNIQSLGKVGSDLLGLSDENTGSSTGRENDITMKIIFPDQAVIQATFNKDETVGDISSFLATILKCPISNIILYTKNPKCDLDFKKPLKNIADLSENILHIRSSLNVPKHSAFPALKEILQPKTQVKLKAPPKRWSISSKLR